MDGIDASAAPFFDGVRCFFTDEGVAAVACAAVRFLVGEEAELADVFVLAWGAAEELATLSRMESYLRSIAATCAEMSSWSVSATASAVLPVDDSGVVRESPFAAVREEMKDALAAPEAEVDDDAACGSVDASTKAGAVWRDGLVRVWLESGAGTDTAAAAAAAVGAGGGAGGVRPGTALFAAAVKNDPSDRCTSFEKYGVSGRWASTFL